MKTFSMILKEKVKKLNIVLADDKPYFRRGMKDLLMNRFPEKIGIIEEVDDGKEFLILMDFFPANLVFIDIDMPGINGIEATSIVRSKNPDLKIYALSAHDDLSYIKIMNTAGADGFISKNEELTRRLDVIIKNYSIKPQKILKETSETNMNMLLTGLIIECPSKGQHSGCPISYIWNKPYNERINLLKRLSKIEKLDIILQHKKCVNNMQNN